MGRKKGNNGNGKAPNGKPKKSRGRPNPGKKRAFLAAFAVCGNVREAAEIADCSITQVYERMKPESPRFDQIFTERFEVAKEEAIQRKEQEAARRAFYGTQRLKFTKNGDLICIPDPEGRTVKVKRITAKVVKGKKVFREEEVEEPLMVPYIEHEYSDTLAIFLLKSLRPEVYRENYTVNGRIDGVHAHISGQMMTKEQLLIEQLECMEELKRIQGPKGIESNGHTNGSAERG